MDSAGGFLRFIRIISMVMRILQFCASVIILGIFSFFLAVLEDNDMHIGRRIKAVEGIAGASALYTILASIFTIYVGRIWFLAAITMLLDLFFAVGFVAIAIMTRHGAGSCTGHVDTPFGSGDVEKNNEGSEHNFTYFPKLSLVCKLQKGTFAVSIIGA